MKYRRGIVGVNFLVYKIADVKIMCRQMEMMFGVTMPVAERIEYKAQRQKQRLENERKH